MWQCSSARVGPVRSLGDSIELLRPAKSVVLGSSPSDCRKAVIAQSVVRVNALYDPIPGFLQGSLMPYSEPSIHVMDNRVWTQIWAWGCSAHVSGFMVPRGVSNSH